MPSDLFTLKPLVLELNLLLQNGRIQKVTQPEKDEIRLEVKSQKERYTLVISANANAPRCHITHDKKENPMTAPAFCMHLRKYIMSSTLESVSIANNDRIIKIVCYGRNELFVDKTYFLYFELMNRYSNVILTDENNIISDCLRHVNFDTEAERVLVPSIKYEFPSKPDKAEIFEYDKIRDRLKNSDDKDNLVSLILGNINGLSKSTALELASRGGLNLPLNNEKIESFIEFLKKTENITENAQIYSPCVNEKYTDYFAFPYQSIENTEYKKCPNLNKAAELFFTKRDNKIRLNNLSKNVVTITRRHYNKLVKNLGFAEKNLKSCDDIEYLKLCGELLTANIYKIKKGDTKITVENYYDNNNPITIKLDELKSPQQNSERYFNRYQKRKRTKYYTVEQIKKLKLEIEYYKSILESLNRATPEDIADIKRELVENGIIKRRNKNRKKQEAPSKPKQFNYKGFTIFVGTNNYLNNYVTFKIGKSNDLWLHTKNEHGSHAIIRADKEIVQSVIKFTAEIVAFYSSARDSQNVAVDYTERKNVRRIKGGGLGMVNYTNYKTIYVDPKDHLETLDN